MQFMKRREFIVFVAGLIACPGLSRAQQSDSVRRVGVLVIFPEADPYGRIRLDAFRQRLQTLGWIDGRNLHVDYRFAEGDLDRMRLNVVEMMRLAPEVIVAANTQTVEALQHETRTVPIVFVQVSDPVGRSIVDSLARPGGNITGFTDAVDAGELLFKRLQVLKEIDPRVTRVGYMVNPKTVVADYLEQIAALGPSLSVTITPVIVHDAGEIDAALARFSQQSGVGLVVAQQIFSTINREIIVSAAARHRVPAIYPLRPFATSGGLVSVGVDQAENFRGAASYVDRILRGEKPADLPVQRPTKIELVLNQKTAKALGIDIPPALLARADEVIE
jgi:putative ABC transport system substrate-binding protein